MNQIDQLKNMKQSLLDDLKKSITYIPNRNHDIYLMMNRYLSDKISNQEKESILMNLSKCINGQSYDQPKGAIIEDYTINEVNRLTNLLDKFLDDLEKNPEKVGELSNKMKKGIQDLHAETKGHLLDTWRIDTLYNWYNLVCKVVL